MIAVIDYGMGNVGSIINMLRKIGVDSILTDDEKMINEADKLILPGVGAFDKGMQNLNDRRLSDVIKKNAIQLGKPLLGICLGMQLLGRKSEEGNLAGLDLIPFDNKRFSFNADNPLKIPHMGWDLIIPAREDPLLEGLDQRQRYYFVHSYHAVCDSRKNILMECDYGYTFTAAVQSSNIYGVQFHPEKSHKYGMALLENFAGRL
ncbi:MAG: imidazole glycerol phosphate synthase subunit HisH [Bacillota bacterium]